MRPELEKLYRFVEKARLRGGEDKLAELHKKGRLTAQERVELLLDPGSFMELYQFSGLRRGAAGDGVICGLGTIDSRPVCVYSQDTTVLGGSIGYLHGRKLYRTIERALDSGIPFIGLNDSPGARVVRLDQQIDSSEFTNFRSDEKQGGSVFYANTRASGAVPQISAILGSCAGISVYSPALTDFIFMVDKASHMFITGPRVVKSVTSEDVSAEELGGARLHGRITGVADFVVDTEQTCLKGIRKLLGFLPSNCEETPPFIKTDDPENRPNDDLVSIVPVSSATPYDIHKVIASVVDNGDFLEVKSLFAPEMVVGFARLGGFSIGIVANQPMAKAGSLTAEGSVKQARFIRFCDAFNIPVILFVDTPAYLPGKDQERKGIICHGSKVLYALCEATVPKIAVIMRKVYGGGQLGMGVLPGMGTDLIYAWPFAEIGTMGAEQSVEVYYAKEIAAAENPQEFRQQKIKEYRELYADPFAIASASTRIEAIIDPKDTRYSFIRSLKLLKSAPRATARWHKKHGNIPL